MQISSTPSYPNDKLIPRTWARLFTRHPHLCPEGALTCHPRAERSAALGTNVPKRPSP